MRALKFFGFVVLFFLFLIWFLPKENIYYFAEKQLLTRGISIDNEEVKDAGFALNAKNLNISFINTDLAVSETLRVLPFLIYNSANMENIKTAEKFQKFLPSEIRTIELKYVLFFPTKIWINIGGDFGKMSGSYGIFSKKMRLVLEDGDNLKTRYPLIYSNFKDDRGELVYESSF